MTIRAIRQYPRIEAFETLEDTEVYLRKLLVALQEEAVVVSTLYRAIMEGIQTGDEFSIIEIVDALPAAGNAGRIVYLTTDGKIYTDDGSAWIVLVDPGAVYEHIGGEDDPLVDTTAIANAAITTAKIAALAVAEAKLAVGAATEAKIAAGAVTVAKIGAGAVTATKIGTDAIETAKIKAGAVTAGEIATNAVTAVKILAGAIETAKIAAGAVEAVKIATGAIVAVKIGAGAVTTAKLDALSVTAAKIAALAVETGHLAANAVTAAKITAGTITATEIAANAIETAKINALAVTAAKIAANTITAAEIAAGTITAAEIAAGTITATEIAAGTITATEILAGTITANEILIGGITIDRLANGLIETFDDMTTGDINGQTGYDWTGSWVGTTHADYWARIEANPGNGKQLRLTDGSATEASEVTLTMNAGKEILIGVIEFDIKQTVTNKASQFQLLQAGTWKMYLALDDDGNMRFNPGDGGVVLQAFAASTWYKIKVYFDCVGRGVVVFVDDVFKLRDDITQADYVNGLNITTHPTDSGYDLYIENLSVVNMNV